MIYFIHNETCRTIKIGCAWDTRRRLSALQISTSNKLVLLGNIAGMKKVEKQVHELVCREFTPKPGECYERPLRISGEWFDDWVLPFVMRLIASPKDYLDTEKKPVAKPASRPKDPLIHECKLVLTFDSGEQFHEPIFVKATSANLALSALRTIAQARLAFLASTVQITTLTVKGCPAKKVSMRGAFATQNCFDDEGLSVIVNSAPDNCYGTVRGVKQYSIRWFHGVPDELCEMDHPRSARPNAQFQTLLDRFAQVLNRNQCVISASNPLLVQGVIPKELCRLPRGELRSKVNRKAAAMRRKQRPLEKSAAPATGIVYFIQDTVTLAIKIGFCLKEPEKRLAALQTGNSNPLKLLGQLKASLLQEKHLHAHFAQFRIQREWFSNNVLVHVEVILKHRSVASWQKAQAAVLHHRNAELV